MTSTNNSIQMNDATIPDGGQSFFLGAPFSKAMTFYLVLFFVFNETMGYHTDRSFVLDWDRVFNEGEIWRVLTSQLTFETLGTLLFGVIVLCRMLRRFEREMGTRRFGTFAVFSSFISLSLEAMIAQMLPTSFSRTSGPYSFVGSLLYLYHAYTPRLHPKFFGVLGFDFSEKAVQYALVFQLLYADGWSAVVPFFCGVAGGLFCTTPPLRLLERYELPRFVYGLCESVGGAFVETPAPTPRRRPPFLDAATAVRPRSPAPPRFPVAPPPSDEMVESLTSMGFEREAVVRTLQQCDNNVEVAANRLLSAL